MLAKYRQTARTRQLHHHRTSLKAKAHQLRSTLPVPRFHHIMPSDRHHSNILLEKKHHSTLLMASNLRLSTLPPPPNPTIHSHSLRALAQVRLDIHNLLA